MSKSWFRSTIFNLMFIGTTFVLCIAYIPALLLPRKVFTGLVRFWIYVVTALEYSILGLTYEVRGKEFLPKEGSFLVAAKHQSQYETIKLRLLFSDPAIILKKELLAIPMWGWYLKKSGVIAIDRGTPEKALRSIEQGAMQMAKDGRPIVIFVQGTRTKPEETPADKPYKGGIARIQQATGLPIVPMALNTGLFWPKFGWRKGTGTAVFEFFEPISPGKDRRELMKILEEKIESESNRLMNETRAEELNEKKHSVKKTIAYVVTFGLVFGGYFVLWHQAAQKVVTIYNEFLFDVAEAQRIHADPVISGFPGPIKLTVANESVTTSEGTMTIENLTATGWPVPFVDVHITTGPISVKSYKWASPLTFDSLEAWAGYWNDVIKITDSTLLWQDFQGKAAGTVDTRQEPFPKFDVNVRLKNFTPLIAHLNELNIISKNEANFTNAGLVMMSTDGEVSVPITQNGQTLYAGPLPVASLPPARLPAQRN
jgi:1-acyl-sn-glycerol-3-phosphate acyltransferase